MCSHKEINKKYFNNKPWLTAALKESIKTKSKSYNDRYKGTNCDEKCNIYEAYPNKLNHLLQSAERNHYQDLLNEHRSNVKKFWQIIMSVINKRIHNPVCTKFKCNDTIIINGDDIANRFNNFLSILGHHVLKHSCVWQTTIRFYVTWCYGNVLFDYCCWSRGW